MVKLSRTINPHIIAGALLGLSLSAGSPVSAQHIYKTVDENGNTVYTDQKPSDDAQPLQLRELTVVDPVDLGETEALQDGSGSEQDGSPQMGLQIVSPAPEETIWNTAYVLGIQVETSRQLPGNSELVYRIDGEERARSRQRNIQIEEVWRGEHQLQVELVDGNGQVITASDPVTFYMRQASALRGPPN